ncbi:PaaI family thioesterase [Leptospira andrefontaineae]|uniref:PaaI family thioesterase n=1 Tax=Leptospira andrefontaineae TaxID=2484976 RepID=A0A4R9HBW2_9LEPT|nr:PaaI family thioesterase [Leptospira andrefontaineae]TGK43902.1 PaaI family thioesterase [Leptospira andrefontaineae]
MANQKDLEDMQKEWEKFSKAAPGLKVPPPAFKELSGEFVSYVRKKEMVCSFYIEPRFSNPMGVFQGGFLAAAFDNTFGPLCYLAAGKPTTTLELSVSYIRMVKENQRITVQAKVVARGNQHIYLEGEAFDEEGKLLAKSTTQVLILRLPSGAA